MAEKLEVVVERGRVWIKRGHQSFMLAYEEDDHSARENYARMLREVLDADTVKVIKTAEENTKALEEVSALMDKDSAPGTPDGDRLELLATLIEAFERDAYPLHG